MIQGTTPMQTFTLPVDASMIDTIRILYKQNEDMKIVKQNADVTLEGNIATVKLTQEDTLRLDYSIAVEIQVRILTVTGDALASHIKRVAVGKLLEKDVI